MTIDKNGINGLHGGLVTSYLVAHLATFPVDGVKLEHVPAEAEKKLKQYESKDRLWPQNLTMKVDEYNLQLETIEESSKNSEVVEKIPINAIQMCSTAKDLKKQKEILLLLTKPSDGNELYCFSCLGTWAKEIQEDINSAMKDLKKSNKTSVRPGTLSRQKHRREVEGVDIDIIPPPPANPAPSVPVSNSVKKRLDHIRKTQMFSKPSDQSFGNDAMDYESVFVYRVDRNVQILNHCLDDIEIFITKLQKASQAALELSERRSRRSSNKNSGRSSVISHGEGIYTIRAKPPKREQYISTLEKLKFCFILLGELQGHIQNPSAQDLIHFLFKPLNIIIQSCRGPELAQTVLSPLHTEKCLKLLRETMTPSEAELFFTLGEKWTKSRESWPHPNQIKDYVPLFNSGWVMPPNNPPPTEHPVILLERLHIQNEIPVTHKVRVIRDFNARDEMELSVIADEILTVLDDSRKWWHCRNEYNQIGYVPSNLLLKVNPRKNSFLSSDPGIEDGHSSISEKSAPDYDISHLGAASVLKSVNSSPRPVSDSTPPPSDVPPPPPVAPPPMNQVKSVAIPPSEPIQMQRAGVTAAAILAARNNIGANSSKQNNSIQKTERREMTDTFKNELHRRVQGSSNAGREFVLPSKTRKLPDASISKRSSPKEVKLWLQSLKFSEITIESLGELNGAQIFTLSKDELRQICDSEGNLVFSKLQIQQNLNESKTGQELNAVLALRKQRSIGELPEQSVF